MQDANLKVSFESPSQSFDSEHPIIAKIKIQTQEAIPAYGVSVSVVRYETYHHT